MHNIQEDILAALSFIEEEMGGIVEYKKTIDATENKELKEMFTKILNDEKQHVSILFGWVSSRIKSALE